MGDSGASRRKEESEGTARAMKRGRLEGNSEWAS